MQIFFGGFLARLRSLDFSMQNYPSRLDSVSFTAHFVFRGAELSSAGVYVTVDIFQFVAIVLTALSMSVHFGTWLTEAPMRETTSGAVFTEIQKGRDRVAARAMPVLENAAILMVAVCVFLSRTDLLAFVLSLAALVLIAADMAVTLTCNVPINKQVQSWNASAPPSGWAELRDRWERFHTIRTALIVSGFILLTASVVFFRVH